MVELDDVPAAEQDAVLREFMMAGGSAGNDALDGIVLDPSLAIKLQSPGGYSEHPSERNGRGVPSGSHRHPLSESESHPRPQPFQFLHAATAALLARHLERQHPQVIAVVTAHLPPQQAADVLRQFQPRLQAEVLRRVAQLDLADPEALRDIERELESLLHDELRLARNRQSGLTAISTILNAAGADRNQLLVNLSRHDYDLVTQLTAGKTPQQREATRNSAADRSAATDEVVSAVAKWQRPAAPPEPLGERAVRPSAAPPSRAERHAADASPPDVPFEELAQLADEDWAVLIRAADPGIVLLALTGASEQLLLRITQQLSRRESQALHSRLGQTGPLRLSDIERAQLHIARLASRLAARGDIRLPERRRFAAAA
jgi:hypothetical protein